MDFVRELKTQGRRVFLDLKLYDIVETVKRAVSKWAARSQPERGAALLHLLAVTVLTSFYDSGLIRNAMGAGVDGIV
jgi:orotidine-5'-phosphate decarboxylase